MYSCLPEALLPGMLVSNCTCRLLNSGSRIHTCVRHRKKEGIWVPSLYAQVLYGKILYKHAEQWPHFLCLHNDSKATEPPQIFVDNQGAIQLAKNPKFYERTKQISVRFHFVRDACKRNAIKSTYLPTSDILACIMMKNLPRDTHWKHAHGLGLVSWDSGEVADRPRVKRLK